MSTPIISVEHLGKRYRLRHQHQPQLRSFRDAMAHGVQRLFSRQAAGRDESEEEFWALQDVSFDICQGEVVGIIGRNGAGKSTLLKVLSRIVEPTTGRVTLRGRVASLLEVGTGFHPELSGRENVFLNGAVLGMTKREIRDRFDEIVAFAEVEKFLDTPVKHYSSGMYVRLAFAVAAHLQPEILVVDEVLAVGDAEFQKKCMGKMGEVSRGGRTVLFVSHNIQAISSLCEKSVCLESGRVAFAGATPDAVQRYLRPTTSSLAKAVFAGPLRDTVLFSSVAINGSDNPSVTIGPGEEITFEVRGVSRQEFKSFRMALSVYRNDLRVFTTRDVSAGQPLAAGEFTFFITVPAYLLRPGLYTVGVGGKQSMLSEWIYSANVASFVVREDWDARNEQENEGVVNIPSRGRRVQRPGVVHDAL